MNMTKIDFDFNWNYLWNSCWVSWWKITTNIDDWEIIIKANKNWLISLATLFLRMANETNMNQNHIHLDQFNSLEEWSTELIIEKDNDL